MIKARVPGQVCDILDQAMQVHGATGISQWSPLSGMQIAGQSGISEQQTTTPLMQPDEVSRFFRRDNFNQILKLAGMPPLQLERGPYYDRADLKGLIEVYS